MDISAITGALAAIKAARDISAAALAVRDWNLMAVEIARMNDQLLQAQQALFTHNAELLGIQQQLFETSDKLRKAEESLAQRASYLLVETGRGQFAYRVNLPPKLGGASQPGRAQALHYVCQSCFDDGRKVVLSYEFAGVHCLTCHVCKRYVLADFVAAELGY